MDWFGDTFFIISTHAPLAGRDSIGMVSCPDGGISTHAPLAGRDIASDGIDLKSRLISTHAPLAGRDRLECSTPISSMNFNPRAPCGARLLWIGSEIRFLSFQPTRPLRGATLGQRQLYRDGAERNFNPRAPCGARQQKSTNHYAHFCDNRQISDAFAQNAACQGILLLFDAGKPCGFWVRTAQVISAHLCFAL